MKLIYLVVVPVSVLLSLVSCHLVEDTGGGASECELGCDEQTQVPETKTAKTREQVRAQYMGSSSKTFYSDDASQSGDEALPEQKIMIESAIVSGSHCRDDNTAIVVSPDQEAITFSYSDFFIESGLNQKANCEVTVTLKLPEGRSLNLFSMQHRGFASMVEPAQTVVTSITKLGHLPPRYFSETINAPIDDDFLLENDFEQGLKSGCGQIIQLSIKTQIRLENDSVDDPSFVNMDSLDVEANSRLNLRLNPCETDD